MVEKTPNKVRALRYLMLQHFMYYLKYEHVCFLRYKTRGVAERFIADTARIAIECFK